MSKIWLNSKCVNIILISFFTIIIVLVVVVTLVMLSSSAEEIVLQIFGIETKDKFIDFIYFIIQAISIIYGMLLGLLKAYLYYEKYQSDKKEQGYERYTTALEKLSDTDPLKRMIAFDILYRLAKTEIETDARRDIFDELCAHLLRTTKHEDYQHSTPTEEIQKLLNILFKPENKDILIFSDLDANLAESHLQGADLQGANLKNANLQGANLQNANLKSAKLSGANLQWANLQNAEIRWANLENALLRGINLQGAFLQNANLQKRNLQWANLQNAELQNAILQGAILFDANLQHANLYKANLKKTFMLNTDLQGANLYRADLQEAFLHKANLQIADLKFADLQGAKLDKTNMRGSQVNENTKMPDGWKKVVKQYKGEDGKETTGAFLVDDKGNVMEYL